ncbi:endonuclease/exonuclease/phosphatase family protein [Aquimarina sp. AU474]|uniref:endonuclease/exonuclease/phosphatase family protein n=1 Tax=Aquimarina sp. AU474 TaxID=2108529 RepID=UPI000D687716|nr:endonuclease/exonuclease/phosphatase family protein [Aquimarina sp. AU474]
MFLKFLFRYIIFGLVFFFQVVYSQEEKEYKINTIAFYNLENLFDTKDDPVTFDDDRTPKGKDHWTLEFYKDKIQNMAKVISVIGADIAQNAPVILGVAEVENRKVLEDLVNDPEILNKNYGIIHFDSPDRRGIDVGLLYQKALFKPTKTKTYELPIYDNNTSKRIYTRDQLVVSGYLDGDMIHIIVNHWPSRRGGTSRSNYKRERAARLNKKIADSLFALDPYAKIIIMGDFNDDPKSASLSKILNAKTHKKETTLKELYNPMAGMIKKGGGSLAWRDSWIIFDQIIVSKELLDKNHNEYRYYKAGIFNEEFLTTSRGKYKGYPFRSYSNGAYTGGYSDHFPVYIYLIKQKKESR